ncbi:hypothetical protein [Pannonibacter sp. P2PFMT1]|uniref:hypothetical protein n=1 Tax=Pannonibacter sp. P2PFMT1 TaxID=2003582 RepID=UPI00164406F4|nr:hypothetical protein [Pannonibacter sp. P2PFMT1]
MTKAHETRKDQQSPARARLQQALGRLAAGTALAETVKSRENTHQAVSPVASGDEEEAPACCKSSLTSAILGTPLTRQIQPEDQNQMPTNPATRTTLQALYVIAGLDSLVTALASQRSDQPGFEEEFEQLIADALRDLKNAPSAGAGAEDEASAITEAIKLFEGLANGWRNHLRQD